MTPEAAPSILLDPDRLARLRATGLLDSETEEAFDRLTRSAARLLRAPVALVSLVDADRQFFKSAHGLPEPWASRRQTPLSHSFCKHVVASGEPLVIEDAREHPLVRDNPAIEQLGVIAYAGVPITSSSGHGLGSFCVIDGRPRVWSADELAVLHDLAAAAVAEIELRHAQRELELANTRLEAHNAILRAVADDTPLTEVLALLVRTLEALTPGMVGSVQLWDAESGTLVAGAAPSLPPEYSAAVDGLEVGPNASPCGTAAFRRELVVADDLEHDPRWAGYRDLAAGFGVRACWSSAIVSAGGELLGTFSLYLPEPSSPSPAQLRHIADASQLAAIAIERRRAEQELARRALHDYLTGLPNRALLAERLSQALARALRNPADAPALALVDLDGFKELNDAHGHDAGDQVLVATAGRLLETVRGHDTVARLGGDEFVVLCHHVVDDAQAAEITARINAAFAIPFEVDGAELQLSASVGMVRAQAGQSADDLLRAADAAMYRVKRAAQTRA